MKIRKIISLFISVGLIFLVFAMCINVDASSSVGDLHTITKVYSSENSDYYDGCEDYDDYRDLPSTITVLTHGLGGSYDHWSNNYEENGDGDFAYNSKSIISKLYRHLNGNMDIYIAKANSDINDATYNYFSLFKLSYSDYENSTNNEIEVQQIDVSKHILLLFNSNISGATHEKVYEQFHDVLDNISYLYKTETTKLPRFNLIGHSRGGIINLMYATDHIYNVDSMYSIDTPYNGSVLGLIDPVMEMMNLYPTDSSTDPTNAGDDDIMNEQVNITLRNAWNAALTDDVDINVVAFGSMTSIDLMRELVSEIASGPQIDDDSITSKVQKYQDLLNTVINVVDTCPTLTSNFLTFVNNLSKILDFFGVNLYDEVLASIDNNLEGDITVDEADQVLSLFNVINHEAVIMDDLFIDTDSQLGYGFSDGIAYNGFKRYVKIFDDRDLSTNCAKPSEPAIPHNLSIMCDTYIDSIVSSITYDVVNDYTVLFEDSTNVYNFSTPRYFNFHTTYEGQHIINANDCEIIVYSYDQGFMNEVKRSSSGSLTVEIEAYSEYVFVITKQEAGDATVSIHTNGLINLGEDDNIDDAILVGPEQKMKIRLKITDLSTYLIKYTNSQLINVYLHNYDDQTVIPESVTNTTDNMKKITVNLYKQTYYLIIENTSISEMVNVSIQADYHIHSLTYIETSGGHLASCLECGYESVLEHVYDTHICIHCGAGTSMHDFDYNYVWVNYKSHTAECACGLTLAALQPHVISSGSYNSGQRFATCILCGGFVEMGFVQLNATSSSINMVTENGSFILPDGIIVLQDEDIEAYINGTLVFYNKNNVPVIK